MKQKGPPPGILKYPSSRFGSHHGGGTGPIAGHGGHGIVPVPVPVPVVPVPGPPCGASVPLCAGPPGFCHAGLSPSRCPQHGGCGVHPPPSSSSSSMLPQLVPPALSQQRAPPLQTFVRSPPGVIQQQRMYQMSPNYTKTPPLGLPPVGPRVAPHMAATDKKSSFVILADGSVIEQHREGPKSPFRGRGFRRDISPSTSRSRSRSISPATRSSTSSLAPRRPPVAGSTVSPVRRPYMEHALTAGRASVNQLTAVFENKSASLPRVRSSRKDSMVYHQSLEKSGQRPYHTLSRSPQRRPYNLSPIPQRSYGPSRDLSPERIYRGYSPDGNSFGYRATTDKSGRRKFTETTHKEQPIGRRDLSPVYRRSIHHDSPPRRKTPPRDYSPLRDQEMPLRRDTFVDDQKCSRSRDPSPSVSRRGCETCRSREASPCRQPCEKKSREASPAPRDEHRHSDSHDGKRPSSRHTSPNRSTRTSREASPARSREPSPMIPSRSREPSPRRDSPSRFERSKSRETSPARKTDATDSDLLKKSASVPRLDRSRSPSLTRDSKSATRKSTPSLIPVPISRLPSSTSLYQKLMNEVNIEMSEMTSPNKVMSPKRVATGRRKSIYEQKPVRVPTSRTSGEKPRGSPPPKRGVVTARQTASYGKSAPSSPKPEKKGVPAHHKSQPSLTPTRRKKNVVQNSAVVSPSKIPLSQGTSPKKTQKDLLSPTWTNSKAKRKSPSPARSRTAKEPSSKPLPLNGTDQNAKGTNERSVPYRVLKTKDSQTSIVRRPTNTSLNNRMKPDRTTLEKLGSAAVAVNSVNVKGLGKRKDTGSTSSLIAHKTTETPKPDVPTPLPSNEPEPIASANMQEPTVDAKATESSTILPPSADLDALLDSTKDPNSLEQPILASLVGGVNNVSEPSSTLVTSTAAAPIELAQPEVTATDHPTNGENSKPPTLKGNSNESIQVPDSSMKGVSSPTIPEAVSEKEETPATTSVDSKTKDMVDGMSSAVKAENSFTVQPVVQSVRASESPPKGMEPSTSKTEVTSKKDTVTSKKDTVREEPDIEVLNANKLPQDAGGRRNEWTKESGSDQGAAGQKGGRSRSCFKLCRRPNWSRPRTNMRAKKGIINRLACWRRGRATRASAEALTATATTVAAEAAKSESAALPKGCLPRLRARFARKKKEPKPAKTAKPAKPPGRLQRGCTRCGAMMSAACGTLFCLKTACCLRSSCRQPGGCCARCCPLPEDESDGAGGRRRSQARTLTRGKSMTASNPELGKLDAALVEYNGVMRGAIPVLPLPLAWVCLVFNVFVPGLGTLSMGLFCLCVGKARFSTSDTFKSRFGALCVDVMVSATQLFTVLFCLVGWGWSIWWGIICLRLAKKYNRIRLAEQATITKPEASINVPPPPSSTADQDAERGPTPKPP